MGLECFDVDGVQAGQAFLHVEQLLFILPLSFVDLLTKEADLDVELFSLASVVFQGSPKFFL